MGFFGKKKDAGSLVSEALALLQAGKEDAGAAKLKEATEADPKHAQAWFCLGTIYSRRGQLEAAVDCYGKSAKHAPPEKQALPIFNMANALQSMEKLDQALKAFTLATKVDPKFADAWINRGRLLDDASLLGRHEEARASIDEAIHLGVRNVKVYNNRGETLAKLERVDESIASFDEALKLDARYTPALFGKARVMCNAKMFGPAKATIDLFIEYSDGTDGLEEPARALIMLCRDAGVS